MLVINPDECIDCGVCVPECPIGAIEPESEDLVEMVIFNRKYSALWERITVPPESPMPDAEKWKSVNGEKKLKELFSEKSGGNH